MTKEEAIENCLTEIRKHLESSVQRHGFYVTEENEEELPAEIPEDHILVGFESLEECSAETYMRAYVAIPEGGTVRHPDGEIEEINRSTIISFVDPLESGQSCKFLCTGFLHQAGNWKPIRGMTFGPRGFHTT